MERREREVNLEAFQKDHVWYLAPILNRREKLLPTYN